MKIVSDIFSRLRAKARCRTDGLPIPSHLSDCFVPIGENTEFEATGEIRCRCGAKTFILLQSNDFGIIEAVCTKCAEQITLFDEGKHGWNGFVCRDDYLDRSLPLEKFTCPKCGAKAFEVTAEISSQGREDFMAECAGDSALQPKDWVNAFESITLGAACTKCDFKAPAWVQRETM